eukprot:SM000100S09452  [mRNA]  locus=s100:441754:450844:- [translate_table: standard]
MTAPGVKDARHEDDSGAAGDGGGRRRVRFGEAEQSSASRRTNRIVNTKYTLLNFLPKNLMEQFSRFMNRYFLLVALLQLWPAITPVNPITTWFPLVLIFSVTACKEGWEDLQRHKRDMLWNEKLVQVTRNKEKVKVKSQDIRVGDLVWLQKNDEAPCDLVMLCCSQPSGHCFVETAALDGETDLKSRTLPFTTKDVSVEELQHVKGVIECLPPDPNVNHFKANLYLQHPLADSEIIPLSISNTVLQFCHIKNTDWVCGVAIYTGNETKMGMSKGLAPVKLAAVDAVIDKLTYVIFAFQLVIILILGSIGNLWRHLNQKPAWYLQFDLQSPPYENVIIPLRFGLLLSIMIPISLKVNMDLVKAFHGKLIGWDRHMYCEETGTAANASNTAISEDLGQVNYLLTDKTGTLTENKLNLVRCCIGPTRYGDDVEGGACQDPALTQALLSGQTCVLDFLVTMAASNTVMPLGRGEGQELQYAAESQDEEALVLAAASVGVQLLSRQGSYLCLDIHGQGQKVFEVLKVLEFTSTRQMMSVVVRDINHNTISVLSKGADEAILRCSKTNTRDIDASIRALAEYAHQGFRTLCLAMRKLDEDEYLAWQEEYQKAAQEMHDDEVAKTYCLLEKELDLLGVTAIEDKLQAGVPGAITMLRQAGMKMCMVTGDKRITAMQVARSCKLLPPEPEGHILVISGNGTDEISASIDQALLHAEAASQLKQEVAVVIDGIALEHAVNNFPLRKLLVLASAGICCRATPAQKAQLVDIVKSLGFRTVAVGDGGNDARMVQQAHVGIGIAGREDFGSLARLILVHGRRSYMRTSYIAQFSIYKSLLVSFTQIFYTLASAVSGTSLFSSFSLMAYNVVYTSLPPLSFAFDKDLVDTTLLAYPHLLSTCQSGRLLNAGTFACWFAFALCHAVMAYGSGVMIYAIYSSSLDEVSLMIVTSSICIAAVFVATNTNSFSVYQHLAIWGTIFIFFAFNLVISRIRWAGMYGVMPQLCSQPQYWLTLVLTVVAGIGPAIMLKYLRFQYWPGLAEQARKLELCPAESMSHSLATPSSSLLSLSTILGTAPSGSSTPTSKPYRLSTLVRNLWQGRRVVEEDVEGTEQASEVMEPLLARRTASSCSTSATALSKDQ